MNEPVYLSFYIFHIGVHVTCHRGMLLLRFQDTGIPYMFEDLPHLFERFYRGEKAKNTGIGIGLSLSKAIIESKNICLFSVKCKRSRINAGQ